MCDAGSSRSQASESFFSFCVGDDDDYNWRPSSLFFFVAPSPLARALWSLALAGGAHAQHLCNSRLAACGDLDTLSTVAARAQANFGFAHTREARQCQEKNPKRRAGTSLARPPLSSHIRLL